MTLATHGVVGTAAATLAIGNPVLAFLLAFLSHLAIDTLPHRDYKMLSVVEGETKLDKEFPFNRLFLYDLARTGTDAFIGLFLSLFIFSLWLFQVPPEIVLIGVVGGVLPDFLQLVYIKTRTRLLLPLQKFHMRIQEGKEREEWPLWKGLVLQAVLVLWIVVILKFMLP
jgi:hypothetical protein